MSVTYEVVNGVAWLTIDRPAARNALSREVREGLWECVLFRGGRTEKTVARGARSAHVLFHGAGRCCAWPVMACPRAIWPAGACRSACCSV